MPISTSVRNIACSRDGKMASHWAQAHAKRSRRRVNCYTQRLQLAATVLRHAHPNLSTISNLWVPPPRVDRGSLEITMDHHRRFQTRHMLSSRDKDTNKDTNTDTNTDTENTGGAGVSARVCGIRAAPIDRDHVAAGEGV
jgi:hypothetical protein